MNGSLVRFGLIGFTLVALAICCLIINGEYTDTIAPDASDRIIVSSGSTIGQSFISRHAGLEAVEIATNVLDITGTSGITLALTSSDQAVESDFRIVWIKPLPSMNQKWQRFEFAPIGGSRNQRFMAEFTQNDSASNYYLTAPVDTYRDGVMYFHNTPQEKQLSLHLIYNQWFIAFDLLKWGVQAILLSVVVLLLFIIPGAAIEAYLLPLYGEAWQVKLALASAMSLCLYPILLVWLNVLNIQSSQLVVWLIVLASSLALLPRLLVRRKTGAIGGHFRIWWQSSARSPDLLWIVAVAVMSLIRLFLLRSVDSPMWGDSVQHAMISQLIVEHGGLFSSWLPYVPYDSLTVHPGFHIITAVIMWALRESSLNATLHAGQIINCLAVLALVPLAHRVTHSRWSGIGVILVAGIASPLPNGFINWGRYPQLMGQAIAPIAIWIIWRIADRRVQSNWRMVLATAVVFAGTFLTYYRMPHYVIIFTCVLFILMYITRRLRRRVVEVVIISGLVGMLLASPWLLRLKGSVLGEGVDAVTVQSTSLETIVGDYHDLVVMAVPLLGQDMIIATFIVVLAAAILRKKPALVILVWGIGLLFLPAARLVRIPGLNNLWVFAVLIGLYMPMSLLVGGTIDSLILGASKSNNILKVLIPAGLVSIILLGMRDRLNAVDSQYRILAPADLHAFAWIETHIPVSAKFAVEGFLVYEGRSVVGSDGGWWISLLAHRQSTLPPQYPLLAEHEISPDINNRVVDFVKDIRKVGISSPEGLIVLCRNGITHIYIGQERGQVAIPRQTPMFPIDELTKSHDFHNIYQQDKVAVFEFDRSSCPKNMP